MVSGSTGGREKNPTYEEVSAHGTGHLEAIEVTYDPAKVSYEQLLDVFWHNVDPGDGGGQFCDKGEQYRSAIFVHGEQQRRAAAASRQPWRRSRQGCALIRRRPFSPAEENHQDFAEKTRCATVLQHGCGPRSPACARCGRRRGRAHDGRA